MKPKTSPTVVLANLKQRKLQKQSLTIRSSNRKSYYLYFKSYQKISLVVVVVIVIGPSGVQFRE